MNTLEGNKIIAEFMGLKRIGSSESSENILEVPVYKHFDKNGKVFGETYYTHHKYHSSWDWLMPVVEKIQSIDIAPAPNYRGYRIEIVVQGYVKISGFPMPTIFKNVSIEGSLINAVWQAVVQFIQWYNKNNKS